MEFNHKAGTVTQTIEEWRETVDYLNKLKAERAELQRKNQRAKEVLSEAAQQLIGIAQTLKQLYLEIEPSITDN